MKTKTIWVLKRADDRLTVGDKRLTKKEIEFWLNREYIEKIFHEADKLGLRCGQQSTIEIEL